MKSLWTKQGSGWGGVGWGLHETVLLGIVVVEVLWFNAVGRNFATGDNVGNIVRHSAEIGLLALAMLPVILTGGIDLSVGSLLGLSAVVFGRLCEVGGWNPWWAGVATLGIGAAGGGLNALLVTRLGLPPLIVTLGTYSLFRGLAEAITRGTATYSKFPGGFVELGHGTVLGLPGQAWMLGGAALGMWVLVHRTTFGRVLRAIGFGIEGARYAGLPVQRCVASVYMLAGVVAAFCGLLFTARVTQARADAGVGYELLAITAVVLGGTSIFGGRGNVAGALLGVVAVAVLGNGLSRILSITNVSRELAGVMTGALLLLALAAGRLGQRWGENRARRPGAG